MTDPHDSLDQDLDLEDEDTEDLAGGARAVPGGPRHRHKLGPSGKAKMVDAGSIAPPAPTPGIHPRSDRDASL